MVSPRGRLSELAWEFLDLGAETYIISLDMVSVHRFQRTGLAMLCPGGIGIMVRITGMRRIMVHDTDTILLYTGNKNPSSIYVT